MIIRFIKNILSFIFYWIKIIILIYFSISATTCYMKQVIEDKIESSIKQHTNEAELKISQYINKQIKSSKSNYSLISLSNTKNKNQYNNAINSLRNMAIINISKNSQNKITLIFLIKELNRCKNIFSTKEMSSLVNYLCKQHNTIEKIIDHILYKNKINANKISIKNRLLNTFVIVLSNSFNKKPFSISEKTINLIYKNWVTLNNNIINNLKLNESLNSFKSEIKNEITYNRMLSKLLI